MDLKSYIYNNYRAYTYNIQHCKKRRWMSMSVKSTPASVCKTRAIQRGIVKSCIWRFIPSPVSMWEPCAAFNWSVGICEEKALGTSQLLMANSYGCVS